MRRGITEEIMITRALVATGIFIVVLVGGLVAASKAPEEFRWFFSFLAFCIAAAAAFGISVITGLFRVRGAGARY